VTENEVNRGLEACNLVTAPFGATRCVPGTVERYVLITVSSEILHSAHGTKKEGTKLSR
jgi:hypothetical protein